MNDYLKIGIWAVVIGAVFAFFWRKGYLARLTNYIQETREELRKCTWPTWTELRASTVLVVVSIAILGVFTVVVDVVFALFVTWMTQI